MNLAAVKAPFQWQLVRVDFEPVRGSEQAGVRPALIVSNESVNSALPVVTVIPLTTSNLSRRIYPTEAFIPASSDGQPRESVALAYQIRTVSKERLLGSYGILSDETLREAVRAALRIHLDLLESPA